MPELERRIDEAFDQGLSAVLVSPDGSFQILPPPASEPNPELLPLY
jgi:hypothetical protein